MTAKPAATAQMTYGWRRFFTRAYWRFQWLGMRMFGYPVNVVGVGTVTIDDPEMECQPMSRETLARLAADRRRESGKGNGEKKP